MDDKWRMLLELPVTHLWLDLRLSRTLLARCFVFFCEVLYTYIDMVVGTCTCEQ